MKIEKLEMPKQWKGHNLLEAKIKNLPGVYLLFDDKLELLYIGKTVVFRNRMNQHVSPRNKARYELTGELHKSTTPLPLGKVSYYSFIEIKNFYERDLTELILLKLFNPPFNNANFVKFPGNIQNSKEGSQ